eukprot:7443317-Alexandrium_andersonii.AAC.1
MASCKPSFYSGMGDHCSLIDYIGIARHAWIGGLARKPVTFVRSGRRLQLVDTVRPVDHMPVALQ